MSDKSPIHRYCELSFAAFKTFDNELRTGSLACILVAKWRISGKESNFSRAGSLDRHRLMNSSGVCVCECHGMALP
jgi:hypothetical protein